MSDQPFDPSASKATPEDYEDTYAGQQGPGVEYENGQFRSGDLQDAPREGRSGSFETQNEGGYGTVQPSAEESSTTPADPEAQEGQGGQ